MTLLHICGCRPLSILMILTAAQSQLGQPRHRYSGSRRSATCSPAQREHNPGHQHSILLRDSEKKEQADICGKKVNSCEMAFASSSSFLTGRSACSLPSSHCQLNGKPPIAPSPREFSIIPTASQAGKKSRRFVPGKGAAVKKIKLEPEEVFIETAPSWTELVVPTLSIFTVIGIIPFVASIARQAWVRYKLTTRRISISSGFQGKDTTEIIYRDISKVKFVRRMAGTGDMVLELKDGAKIELRTVPDLDKIYDYIMTKVDDDVKAVSGAA